MVKCRYRYCKFNYGIVKTWPYDQFKYGKIEICQISDKIKIGPIVLRKSIFG